MHEINLDVLTSELMAINCLTNGPSWTIIATKERRFHDICDIVEQCDKDQGCRDGYKTLQYEGSRGCDT